MSLVCYWLSPCYLRRPVLCLRRAAVTAVTVVSPDKLFVTVIDILDYGESIFTIQISANKTMDPGSLKIMLILNRSSEWHSILYRQRLNIEIDK